MAGASGGSAAGAYLARADLRRRWLQTVAFAVLAGLALGASLAALAGARRTASAYRRHLVASHAADLELNAGNYTRSSDAAIRRLPGVVETSVWAALPVVLLDRNGQPNPAGPLAFTSDGRFYEMDRVSLSSGRMPRRGRRDEAVVNQFVLDQLHLAVGDSLTYAYFHYGPDFAPALDEPARFLRVRIVGVMVPNEDVAPDPLDRTGRVLLSPALMPEGSKPSSAIDFAFYGVRLRDGADGIAPLQRAWRAQAADHNRRLPPDDPNRWGSQFHLTPEGRDKAERAVRPLVSALVLFGALSLVATVAFASLAASRLASAREADLGLARILGAGRREVTIAGLAVPLAGVTGAILVATAAAAGVSPLFPIGPFRAIEPARGVQVDPLVLGTGAALLALVAVASVAVVLRRIASTAPLAPPVSALHPSRVASWLTRSGLPAAAVLGARQALEPGRGRTAVPTRSTLVSMSAAVLVLVAAVVFAGNLRGLDAEPRRFGWPADAVAVSGAGYDTFHRKDAVAFFRSHGVTSWRFVTTGTVAVNGVGRAAAAFGPGAGSMAPTLVEGTPPRKSGEVALGRETMRALHVRVGDRVELDGLAGSRRATVTGLAVFPVLGAVNTLHTGLGRGVWLAAEDAPLIADPSAGDSPFNFALLRLGPGAEVGPLGRAMRSAHLSNEEGDDVVGVLRPPEVATAASLEGGQIALAGLLTVVAVTVLALTLAAVVRRRRRELALHRALGFTSGQLGAAMLWQSLVTVGVALAVGLPLGIAFGRWLWTGFAERINVVAVPDVPALALVVLTMALVIVAGIVSLRPAVRAARTSPATWLRTE